MGHFLVTAGPVHAHLDDNKLMTNRSRGIWAKSLAQNLRRNGHQVTILVSELLRPYFEAPGCRMLYHKGFASYKTECQMLAEQVDGAVMASAVLNWIPAEPYDGKMPTHEYKAGDIIQVPFVLAPRVIDMMRPVNPKLNLVGCKMTSRASKEELIDAAYDLLLRAKCNVVVANDMTNLKIKHLVYPDRTVITYDGTENKFWDGFEGALLAVLKDEHYTTNVGGIHSIEVSPIKLHDAKVLFDKIADRYRDRFVTLEGEGWNHTFGAIAVRIHTSYWLMSPRHKAPDFTSEDAVVTRLGEGLEVCTLEGKASLNAPHMISMGEGWDAPAVLHLHEQMEGWDTLPYHPPGTKRDKVLYGPEGLHSWVNIEGHGFIACLNTDLSVMKKDR